MRNVVFKCTVVLLTSLLMVVFSPVVSAKIIYGLDKARDFNSSQRGPFIIQAGSFHSAQKARQLRNQLAPKVKYPVRVIRSQHNYVVQIGSLPSAAAVRQVGRSQRLARPIVPVPVSSGPIFSPEPEASYETSLPPVPVFVPPQPVLPLTAPVNGNWFVAADIGPLWSRFNNTMTINNGSGFPPPQNVDLYSAAARHSQPMLALMAGYRWQQARSWIPAYSLALRYQHVFSQNIVGTISQYSLPEFNNYYYSWAMDANIVSLYSKINLYQYDRVLPYFALGLGGASNHTRGYQETALSGVTPRISPNFAARSEGQFSYTLGAGIDFLVRPQVIISLGYEYQSLGSVSSGAGQTTWSSTNLNLKSVSTNTALISVTYLIGNPTNYVMKP